MQIIPSFLVDEASCTRQFESELSLHSLASLFPIKEGIFSNPSVSLSKGSSTSNQAFLLRRKDVTALRCSEPLRSKVGGPSKVSPCFAGWDRLAVMGSSAYVLFQIIQNANLNELILLHYCSYQTKSKVYHFLYGIPYSSSSCLSKNGDYILPVSDCLLPKA